MWRQTYKGKRILVTGHTGFKGGWLTLWLGELGANVCGYALPPNTQPSLFETIHLKNSLQQSIFGDILDRQTLNETFQKFQPEIVFHLAAQPLVRLSYTEPIRTYETNVLGTLNVLEAARHTPSVKAFVNITTDKCYENKETTHAYTEDDPLGGYDMYSSSKGCVEILSASYRRSFLQNGGYALATVRAGNVIGGGDWAQDRLIPDCIRSIEASQPIRIRSPHATRPWQHVLEPLSGYLLLGHLLYTQGTAYAQAFNFGPFSKNILTVQEVAQEVIDTYGKGSLQIQETPEPLHEATLLTLDITKAQTILGWMPVYTAQQAIERTVVWYKNFYQNKSMRTFTLQQIHEYTASIPWKKI